MKNKRTKTEEANIELNETFYGKNDDQNKESVTPMINNSNVALVLDKNRKNEEEEKMEEDLNINPS